MTSYVLEVYKLNRAYEDQESLKDSTRLQHYESDVPFASFHVGETISDGAAMTYYGRIQHIHHAVGGVSGGDIIHVVSLYVFDEESE